MITYDRVVRFEVYQLLCELKIKLLQAGHGRLRSDLHEDVFDVLVLIKKYCRSCGLEDILEDVAEMQDEWLFVHPGEEGADVVDSLLATIVRLCDTISPFKMYRSSETAPFR